MPSINRPLMGIGFAFATTIVGATASAASKHVASMVPVTSIVLIQFIIGLAVLAPWALRQSKAELASDYWGRHIIRSLAGFLGFYCFYLALDHVPLVDASLLRHSAPLFVAPLAWLWLRAKIPASRWLPIVLGFVGIAIILRPSSSPSIWHLIGLGSGLTLALSMLSTRLLSATDSGNKILFYYHLISLLLSLPIALWFWQPIPLQAWPYLIYNSLSIFAAMWLYTKAYSYAKASVISPIGYFSVVNAGILGWLIWGHIPDQTALFGIAVVILAGLITVYLTARDERRNA
ncbi:MAG: DMT family transporter [Cellvibrionaceae bacterium]|nr:DMT family transporter [Cellvibrionaceae bacterium]